MPVPGLPVGTYPKNETPLIVAGIFKFGEMQPSIWKKHAFDVVQGDSSAGGRSVLK